jgi:D-cysteine desulfhydrase family pyridoxal phosphate-dependent enzyme
MSRPLADALARYPRVSLTRVPTPLDRVTRVGEQIGLDLYLKRDDLTDLAMGGDKPRKLEYEVARAVSAGATVLVTVGSAQSNHARLTTAAARRVGMGITVVLGRDDRVTFQGNLLTVRLMGADVRLVDTADHWALEEDARVVCDELRAAGETPHFIPVSGSTPHSCLGYVRAGLELVDQLGERELEPAAIYVPCGTGGILVGLTTALRDAGVDCPIVGISVNRPAAQCYERIDAWWRAVSELLELDPNRPRGPIEVDDGYIGREYGDPTEACLDAILRMGSTEGILLDPVYSGKVFAGLCGHQAAGRWPGGASVVMLHSGGTPALFAYQDALAVHLDRKKGVEH